MEKINIGFNTKLENQLGFIREIDKVKNITRQSRLFDNSRYENDAEHSWTICVMALLLKEYADFEIHLEKVIPMLLIHDIVEIDAGDTFLYAKEREDVHGKELKAAERIFGLLDHEQRDYFLNLWREFEKKETNDAKFANIFDRLEPLMQNFLTEGYTWKKHKVTYEMVIEKNKGIKEASQAIWQFVLRVLDKAVELKYLEKACV